MALSPRRCWAARLTCAGACSLPWSSARVTLLATFGIAAKLRGTAFFDVVVEPADFAFFQALPVAVRDRVPGTPR